ncbi:MAG TPA: hypothetical protein VMR25_19135 [Planctomycetaceae bacterium]|jgi:hypothetical protein|nr:hypothetical protein [Planctomycetaceae bacterium]
MSFNRLMVPAVGVALALTSTSFAQNRMHRHAVWANRPKRAAAAAYAANVGYRGGATTGDVQTLTQAYSTLASADHDYQGHRIKAMEAIRKAARLMGQKIAGDGKAKEQQAVSDTQLRGVQTMLQKVRGSVSGRNQQRVVQHINEAMHHLTVALSIK